MWLKITRGLTLNMDGILWDDALRTHMNLPDSIYFCTMHQLVSNGIVQAETKLLMDHLKTLGYPWEKLATFASSGWSVASSIGTPARVRDYFSDARKLHYQRNHVSNPPASEMLLIMPGRLVLCTAGCRERIGTPSSRQCARILRVASRSCDSGQKCKDQC